jgi:hypothetical protein
MVLLTAACTDASAELDTCSPRVQRMRQELASADQPGQAPSASPAWVHDLYRQLGASHDINLRARLLQDGIGRSIDGCYGLADAFRAAADAPVEVRRATMARVVPDALVSCQCRGVDVDSLGFLLRLSPVP